MSCLWNGSPMASTRREGAASECCAMIERGMRRLGLDRAPAQLNKLLVNKLVPYSPSEHAGHRRGHGLPCGKALMHTLAAAWKAMPDTERDIMVLAARHNLQMTTARKALFFMGIRIPSIAEQARLREVAKRRVAKPAEAVGPAKNEKLVRPPKGDVERRKAYELKRGQQRKLASDLRKKERADAVLAMWRSMPKETRSALAVARRLRHCPRVVAAILRAASEQVVRHYTPSPRRTRELAKMWAARIQLVLAEYDAAKTPEERQNRRLGQKLGIRPATIGDILRSNGRRVRGDLRRAA